MLKSSKVVYHKKRRHFLYTNPNIKVVKGIRKNKAEKFSQAKFSMFFILTLLILLIQCTYSPAKAAYMTPDFEGGELSQGSVPMLPASKYPFENIPVRAFPTTEGVVYGTAPQRLWRGTRTSSEVVNSRGFPRGTFTPTSMHDYVEGGYEDHPTWRSSSKSPMRAADFGLTKGGYCSIYEVLPEDPYHLPDVDGTLSPGDPYEDEYLFPNGIKPGEIGRNIRGRVISAPNGSAVGIDVTEVQPPIRSVPQALEPVPLANNGGVIMRPPASASPNGTLLRSGGPTSLVLLIPLVLDTSRRAIQNGTDFFTQLGNDLQCQTGFGCGPKPKFEA